MMTDNELKKWNKDAEDRIIKALECCADEGNIDACDDCPCQKGKCISTTPYVLDLINRQKAEIERLESELKTAGATVLNLYSAMENIKAEAVKEFAELLIDEKSYPHPNELNTRIVYVSDIQEMAGDV